MSTSIFPMEGVQDIRWNIRKFCKDDWPYPALQESDKQLLYINIATRSLFNDAHSRMTSPEEIIIEKSEIFPVPFPISTVRVKQLKERKPLGKLRRNITSTYPLIHERVLLLMEKFLLHKTNFGTDIEKQLYFSMSVCGLIDRILKKRAACFVGPYDKYKLLTGEEGASGWENIGTSAEKAPLTLENCLSYDEMKLSAMVYVSGYTECINNGARDNSGVVREDSAEDEAVIIGVIGPRFHRRGKMDYEDILITEEQNTYRNGYKKDAWDISSFYCDWFPFKVMDPRKLRRRVMWADFYGIENNAFEDITQPIKHEASDEQKLYEERFIKLQNLKFMHPIFDNEVYYKRISIIAESTLLEANYRAEERGKTAFLNVVGCGLGVWMISPHQADVYVLTFLDRIRALLDARSLSYVSDVNFAYIDTSQDIQDIFPSTHEGDGHSPKKRWFFIECKEHAKGGINVQMQNREPSAKLTGEHEGKLLVMTYPWDSNAHPGNEFWFGSLTSSGDPAAACSTQVAELHNAHINPAVSGENVRVAGRRGLKPLSDYCHALIA